MGKIHSIWTPKAKEKSQRRRASEKKTCQSMLKHGMTSMTSMTSKTCQSMSKKEVEETGTT